MKAALFLGVLANVLLGVLANVATVGAAGAKDDRAVTKVVKMLEAMLEKSKEDGDTDRKIYAKFLCYCNTKKETKTKEIEDLAVVISMLENKAAELKGSSGELSSEVAALKMAMSENKAKQAMLTKIRKEEEATYEAMKADSEFAIEQMNSAIKTLAEVGADQTLGEAAADHNQFMAGYGLSFQQKNVRGSVQQQKKRVQEALTAAAAFLEAKQANAVQSFMQAPFTGTYTAQSGEVVGILKQMRDTFEANLATATATEEAAVKEYNKIMAALEAAYAEMASLYKEKEAKLGSNDDALATTRDNLADATKEKETREAFLAEMIPMCDAKTKEYNERNEMRASEDAAVSEAIAILNSDTAFATFGTVDATSGGASFLQYAAIQRHSHGEKDVRVQVQQLLQKTARSAKSLRLVKIVALLQQASNPFTAVIEAIDKLVVVIEKEGEADKENLEWCNTERTTNDQLIADLDQEIAELLDAIAKLDEEIDAPETGLKARIEATEISLKENYHSQETQTEDRTAANQAYQADIANLVEAEGLLSAAISVLTKYYDTIGSDVEMEAPKVLAGETEAVPETFHEEKGYKGQSSKGGEVIKMLTFIEENTKKEETFAHSAEHEAQHMFEDSMAELKSEEADLQASLASLKETLAEKEKERFERKKDLKRAEEHLAATKAYLLSIKPGCDFITENIKYRDERRASESDALLEAKDLLMGTPVYKAAVAEAHLASLGKCRETCVENGEEHVICKACLAEVTIPGYCAGHPDTEGC
jgi:hypothetical protein